MKRILTLIVVALFLTALSASATTVSYESYVATNQIYTATPFSGTFSLPEFNPAKGTLTGVSLTYTLSWSSLYAQVHNSSSTSSAEYDFTGQFTSNLSGSTITSQRYSNALYSTGDIVMPANGTNVIAIADPTGSASLDLTTDITVPLTAFVGTPGNFVTYGLRATNSTDGYLDGNAIWTQTALAIGELVITYTYDPAPPPVIPEPATMAFAGAGLLLFGYIGRRFVRH